jgi:hypothetical protein
MKASALLIAGALAASLIPTLAGAQPRYVYGEGYFNPAREAPPLIVRKRPFTDSGTSVPLGYDNEYMVDQTETHRPVYSSFMPDRFGQDVLPRPFDGLGLY